MFASKSGGRFVSTLENIVATILAEVATDHPQSLARLEQIIAGEEGAATASITESGIENPTTVEIYGERAVHRSRIWVLARMALTRILALRG